MGFIFIISYWLLHIAIRPNRAEQTTQVSQRQKFVLLAYLNGFIMPEIHNTENACVFSRFTFLCFFFSIEKAGLATPHNMKMIIVCVRYSFITSAESIEIR